VKPFETQRNGWWALRKVRLFALSKHCKRASTSKSPRRRMEFRPGLLAVRRLFTCAPDGQGIMQRLSAWHARIRVPPAVEPTRGSLPLSSDRRDHALNRSGRDRSEPRRETRPPPATPSQDRTATHHCVKPQTMHQPHSHGKARGRSSSQTGGSRRAWALRCLQSRRLLVGETAYPGTWPKSLPGCACAMACERLGIQLRLRLASRLPRPPRRPEPPSLRDACSS
jgi:hypothetical protein